MIPDQLASNGWTAEKWDELEAMARAEVDCHAQLRHVIPRGPEMLGAYSVVVPSYKHDPATGTGVALHATEPPLRLSAKFQLKAEQLGDYDAARLQLRRAARLLAAGEDIVLFDQANDPPGTQVDKVLKKDTSLSGNASGTTTAEQVAALVANGIDALQERTPPFYAPYGLAWNSPKWTEAVDHPDGAYPRGQRAAIHALLGPHGHLCRVAGKPSTQKPIALLFGLDPFAIDLVFVECPTIALVEYKGGDIILRLEERFLLRISDPHAIQQLMLGP